MNSFIQFIDIPHLLIEHQQPTSKPAILMSNQTCLPLDLPKPQCMEPYTPLCKQPVKVGFSQISPCAVMSLTCVRRKKRKKEKAFLPGLRSDTNQKDFSRAKQASFIPSTEETRRLHLGNSWPPKFLHICMIFYT